jgi:hypothetical protein
VPRFVGLALATLCIALLALPGEAAATRTVPPGVSGAAQYMESVPGAGGEESTKAIVEEGQAAEGGDSEATRKLGTENAAKLEALGPEGESAASLAASSAGGNGRPGGDPVGAGKSAGADGTEEATPPHHSGGSGVGEVVGQLSGSEGSGGMGLVLPLLIAMAVVAAAGYLIGRRRVIAQDRH